MKINGVDVSTFGASQHTVNFGVPKIEASAEWLPDAILPHFGKTEVGLRDFTITMIVKGASRHTILNNVNQLIVSCVGNLDIELDGYPEQHIIGILKKEPKHTEVAQRQWHKVEIIVTGYRRNSSMAVRIMGGNVGYFAHDGSAEAPVRVTILAHEDIDNFTIQGLSRNRKTGEEYDIIVPHIANGHTFMIDGMTGLITDNGKLADIYCRALPTLKAYKGGNQNITVVRISHQSTTQATVTVEYYTTWI